MSDELTVGVACGHCGGDIHMTTCDQMRGTGHYDVLWSTCLRCGAQHATKGCDECKENE